MELKNFSNDLQELSSFEYNDINGGESLWYWLAYGAGRAARGFSDFVDGQRQSTSDWNLTGVK